ncbi:MAG TPA: DNA polymerase IV [Arenimonas sp.]|nr:DNA polymerase IV [Arenimonas sp.]HOZ05162.1 DNA polymerase IV [Arenimonas sp.]HPO23117.1 DNA polymerase IV [Arenimonas sp.]HPW33255.1 DNA polymerase IV [Arenimonas sp.]
MSQRKIVHIDMDAFYASVEQRDDPGLRGKPVVVAWRGARSVVCAASYEARKFGVRSAMPAVRAERLCPDAIFVPPDFVRYKAVSRHVREIFSRHTDMIEPLSLDEAYLDVTNNKLGLASATEVALQIRHAIFEETRLTASAGIAPNKFLAKIASDWNKPNGQYVIKPSAAFDFLTPLPVGRLPGVGKVMEAKLAKLDITTVGDIRQHPAQSLEQYFGRWGIRLHELSMGIDNHKVESERPTQQISSEDTFQDDLLLQDLAPHILRLAEKTWAAYLREERRSARTIVLKLKTSDFQTLTRSYTPDAPVDTLEDFQSIAIQLRERVNMPPNMRFRLVGIGLANFIDSNQITTQQALFS